MNKKRSLSEADIIRVVGEVTIVPFDVIVVVAVVVIIRLVEFVGDKSNDDELFCCCCCCCSLLFVFVDLFSTRNEMLPTSIKQKIVRKKVKTEKLGSMAMGFSAEGLIIAWSSVRFVHVCSLSTP